MVLEKTLASPLDCKEIQLVHPKGNKSWMVIGRTDAEAETPILWTPDVKSWFIGKDPNAGKDWRWGEKEMTEDEMVEWHHWLSGLEFEQAPRVGDGKWGLACCSPWSCKELDMTERMNWTERQNTYEWEELVIFYSICHPVYLTYMQSTSWEMLDWKKHKLESRLPG